MNGRRRKNRILSLHQEEGIVEGEENLIQYITKFYKDLFGQADTSTIGLSIQDAPGITKEQASLLVKPFSMEEIHCSVFYGEEQKARS